MFTIFVITTVVLVTLTVLPLWRHEAWWVRVWDFPRLQLFVISLTLIAAESMILDLSEATNWSLISISVLCLLYHSWWIIPYTRLVKVEVPRTLSAAGQRKISILSANVLTSNHNAPALIDLVRAHKPDILVTLESDAWWQTQLDELETDYPYAVKCPLDNLYGMHVYSRLPLTDSRLDYLVEDDKPSIHTLVTLTSGQQVRAHFLHPAPPSPTENAKSSKRDAELIIVAQSVADTDMPVIVAGDLNDVAWSETTRLFRKISGLLDPRIGRGMYNTFHADHWFIRWPLDHLFHSSHFTLVSLRRLPNIGSDHFPLLTELVYETNNDDLQNSVELDTNDLSLATEKAMSEGVNKDDVAQPGHD